MPSPDARTAGADTVFKAYMAVISVMTAALLALLVYGFISNMTVSRDLKETLSEVNRFERTGGNPPTEERVAYLESVAANLNVYLDEFRNFLFLRDTRAGKRTGDALQFKEKLYAIEKNFRDQADAAKITGPKSFGFERYQTVLPKPEELEDLFYEQEIFEQVTAALLATTDLTIEEFMFDAPAVIRAEGETPRTEFRLKLTMESSFPHIVSFLDRLRMFEHLILVDRMEWTQNETASERITVTFILRAVYL